MTDAIRERWAAVRDAFPWALCAERYRVRGWRYGTDYMGGRSYYPDASQLRATADHLFESCLRQMSADGRSCAWVDSGRITVRIVNGEPGIVCEATHDPDTRKLFRREATP